MNTFTAHAMLKRQMMMVFHNIHGQKIMLDQIVDGRSIIKSTLDKYNATKVSEFKPEQYLSALTDTINNYKEDLEKKDPQNADEKLKEMIEWVIPF